MHLGWIMIFLWMLMILEMFALMGMQQLLVQMMGDPEILSLHGKRKILWMFVLWIFGFLSLIYGVVECGVFFDGRFFASTFNQVCTPLRMGDHYQSYCWTLPSGPPMLMDTWWFLAVSELGVAGILLVVFFIFFKTFHFTLKWVPVDADNKSC